MVVGAGAGLAWVAAGGLGWDVSLPPQPARHIPVTISTLNRRTAITTILLHFDSSLSTPK
jgi:hypothetical protein